MDKIIDECDTLINLREVILLHRVKYSTTGDIACLSKAMGCLERYFFLLAFSAYVNEWEEPSEHKAGVDGGEPLAVPGTHESFREWLSNRTEIWRMLETLRIRGPRYIRISDSVVCICFVQSKIYQCLQEWNRIQSCQWYGVKSHRISQFPLNSKDL